MLEGLPTKDLWRKYQELIRQRAELAVVADEVLSELVRRDDGKQFRGEADVEVLQER